MKSNKKTRYPVDFTVNEQTLKIVALQAFLLSAFFAITGDAILVVILSIDFFLRSVSLAKFSPLIIAAAVVVKILAIENIPVDPAPKKFSARIGFMFSLLVLIFWFTGVTSWAIGFAVVLSLVSFLESTIGSRAERSIYALLKTSFGTRKNSFHR